MARRNHEPAARPYRWADTPIDPLGPSGSRPRRSRAWLTWTVVIVAVLGAAALNASRNRSSGASAPRAPSPPVTVVVTTATQLAPAGPVAPPTGAPASSPIGGTLSGDGAQVTVHDVQTTGRNGFAGNETLLTATVSVTNGSTNRISYSALDWEVQFPDGHITNATPSMRSDELDLAGALVPGGTATGTVSFDVTGTPTGPYEIHYRPMLSLAAQQQLVWTLALP